METFTVMIKNMRKDIRQEGIEKVIRLLIDEGGEGLIRGTEGDSILLKEEEVGGHIPLREEEGKDHILPQILEGLVLQKNDRIDKNVIGQILREERGFQVQNRDQDQNQEVNEDPNLEANLHQDLLVNQSNEEQVVREAVQPKNQLHSHPKRIVVKRKRARKNLLKKKRQN
jgi:hypothetical protein